MKAVLQRVLNANVNIDGKEVAKIDKGLLILLGVKEGDTTNEAKFLSEKISKLRIFEDENEKMNLSVLDSNGEIIVVPNFTLCADARKGNRPSFIQSEKPDIASDLFDFFSLHLSEVGIKKVEKGVFGADMKVSLINDGPVTLVLDTDEIMPKK